MVDQPLLDTINAEVDARLKKAMANAINSNPKRTGSIETPSTVSAEDTNLVSLFEGSFRAITTSFMPSALAISSGRLSFGGVGDVDTRRLSLASIGHGAQVAPRLLTPPRRTSTRTNTGGASENGGGATGTIPRPQRKRIPLGALSHNTQPAATTTTATLKPCNVPNTTTTANKPARVVVGATASSAPSSSASSASAAASCSSVSRRRIPISRAPTTTITTTTTTDVLPKRSSSAAGANSHAEVVVASKDSSISFRKLSSLGPARRVSMSAIPSKKFAASLNNDHNTRLSFGARQQAPLQPERRLSFSAYSTIPTVLPTANVATRRVSLSAPPRRLSVASSVSRRTSFIRGTTPVKPLETRQRWR
eukprot:gnl/Spiro4/17906_TR9540_c0_g1_i1.p1 gnl/Spiro4/17906_TR9540_c0_g1~~gnl/Spiro4/17906_TR9540_c0_g1_i1.p1  ORF type:complete len:365 (-),score=37.91 gnl/Spiro4/17906_TR9540_c0_g1_i1:56-1150(-)